MKNATQVIKEEQEELNIQLPTEQKQQLELLSNKEVKIK
jgi:hypothetical protein